MRDARILLKTNILSRTVFNLHILFKVAPYTVLAKIYRFHSNTDYFLAVIRMKMKLVFEACF